MKTVLLYSGGLDSYCAAVILQPDILLAVDTGTAYGAVELERMQTPPGQEERLHVVSFDSLAQWERSTDLILPARNAYLTLLAANYGDTIYLGATAGDRVTDKNQGFADRMNELFQHLYQPQWWLPEGRKVQVELPLKHLSKREIVAHALEAGATRQDLVNRTFSCYFPTTDGQPCAECKPCIRRFIALLVNDCIPDVDCSEGLAEYVATIRDGRWDRGDQEAADVIEAHLKLCSMKGT